MISTNQTIDKTSIISKAMSLKVITKNMKEKLDTEDLVYLNRLMLISDNFTIESLLENYTNKYSITNDYKYFLTSKKEAEQNYKSFVEETLKDALYNIPEAIMEFIAVFLIGIIQGNFDEIKEKSRLLLEDKNCTQFLDTLETKLLLENPILKTNVLRFIKRKYSYPQNYYYTDLIINYTGYTTVGLLYILADYVTETNNN